jgi:hypothetical protein
MDKETQEALERLQKAITVIDISLAAVEVQMPGATTIFLIGGRTQDDMGMAVANFEAVPFMKDLKTLIASFKPEGN